MLRKKLAFILSIFMILLFAVPAMAKDSTSNILTVSIKVDQNLRNLEVGSSLGNISESDFTTGSTDRYHVESVDWVNSGNADNLQVGSEPKVKRKIREIH